MKKKWVGVLLVAAMVLSMAACGSEATGNSSKGERASENSAEMETFKIGVFQPLSGASAAYGNEARNGIEMAIDYVNKNGGFNGIPGEAVVYDTQCSVEEAVKVVSKLIDQDHVDTLIGSLNSSEMFAGGEAANQNGVYTLSLGTSASVMAEDWPYVFRATMNNAASAPEAAKMIQELNYESVAIFYGQDDASYSTYEAFVDSCVENNIEIVDSESYDQGDTDFSAQVTNIVNSQADCVYISVIGETGPTIVKQLRQYGYKGVIFDRESFMATQIEIAGEENSNYIAFVMPYVTYDSIEDIDIESIKKFAELYQETYGEINKTDSAYRGWDSVMVMWQASKIAGSNDSDALKDATGKIKDMEGLGGTIDFTNGNREGYNEYNQFILVNGKICSGLNG